MHDRLSVLCISASYANSACGESDMMQIPLFSGSKAGQSLTFSLNLKTWVTMAVPVQQTWR